MHPALKVHFFTKTPPPISFPAYGPGRGLITIMLTLEMHYTDGYMRNSRSSADAVARSPAI